MTDPIVCNSRRNEVEEVAQQPQHDIVSATPSTAMYAEEAVVNFKTVAMKYKRNLTKRSNLGVVASVVLIAGRLSISSYACMWTELHVFCAVSMSNFYRCNIVVTDAHSFLFHLSFDCLFKASLPLNNAFAPSSIGPSAASAASGITTATTSSTVTSSLQSRITSTSPITQVMSTIVGNDEMLYSETTMSSKRIESTNNRIMTTSSMKVEKTKNSISKTKKTSYAETYKESSSSSSDDDEFKTKTRRITASVKETGFDSMKYYMKTMGNHELLKKNEEIILAREIQILIKWEEQREELEAKLMR